jgi:Xaa-Pro aminopeptidase
MEDKIIITDKLQTACYEAFSSIVAKLQSGMSELEIAKKIREALKQKKISEYWYDVPIFVIIGADRFFDIAKRNYPAKSPHPDIFLQEGDPIYIDIHPRDTTTKIWGDWNSMVVFRPGSETDEEQVSFLEEVRKIHRKGIEKFNSCMTAADVAEYYFSEFEKRTITLSDVRNNVGHSMHSGPKLPEKRTFLEKGNNTVLSEGIYAIEPGGYRKKKSGKGFVIGRFEDAIYIPKSGNAKLLGKSELLPLVS